MVSMIISPVKMLARTDMPFFHSFNHDHENFFEALFDGICRTFVMLIIVT